jgi:signal transduction histidine kinase
LISNILDLTKIEAGKMDFEWKSLSIHSLVHDVVSTVDPTVKINGNVLNVNCPGDVGNLTIITDPTKAKQVLINLLGNAAKFTHHGEITFTVNHEKDQPQPRFIFEIKDTGIGMSQQQIGKIFNAFTQASREVSIKYGGTGLGLAICRRLCDTLGGEISVSSEPDVGSTFTVTFPATPDYCEVDREDAA